MRQLLTWLQRRWMRQQGHHKRRLWLSELCRQPLPCFWSIAFAFLLQHHDRRFVQTLNKFCLKYLLLIIVRFFSCLLNRFVPAVFCCAGSVGIFSSVKSDSESFRREWKALSFLCLCCRCVARSNLSSHHHHSYCVNVKSRRKITLHFSAKDRNPGTIICRWKAKFERKY